MKTNKVSLLVLTLTLFAVWSGSGVGAERSASTIYEATLMEAGTKTPEISTAEMRKILAEKSAIVFDARPHMEYAISHIPGALNVSGKPGVPKSLYVSDVAEIGRLVRNDRATPIVLYCDGPFCGKSKRLSEELLAAGYTNVRRYQLGIPVWRALGGVAQIEADAIPVVFKQDKTAVFFDARDREEFTAESIPSTRNLPLNGVEPCKDCGEVKRAKDDGRLPVEDRITRIIVFGRDGAQAKAVAEALTQEAFHNVSFFGGSFAEMKALIWRILANK